MLRVGRLILDTLRSARNRVLGVVVGVDTRQPLMALTFDDGPDPDTTPAILDVLARHRARATFFLIGRAADQYPAIVDAIVRSGHAIGHHTWDHVSLPELSAAERRAQVARGADTMPAEGRHFFRPPYGHLDLASWWTVRRLGHDVVAWSDHIRDWHDEDADTFAARLREVIRPGAIVLLHDARQPFEATSDRPRHALVRALDIVLSEAGPNLRFVTVPELLTAGRPTRVVRWRSPPAPAPARMGRSGAGLAEGGRRCVLRCGTAWARGGCGGGVWGRAGGARDGHHAQITCRCPSDDAARRAQVVGGAESGGPHTVGASFGAPFGHLDLAPGGRCGGSVTTSYAWSDHIRDWHDEDADVFAAPSA